MDKRYNTGNPRPSNSMKDLNDNALAYDDFLNSESDTFIDRFGNARDTIIGATKKMAAATDAVIDEARQNLIPLSRQYMTLAAAQADIANIPVGSTTYYRSPDDSALAIEVINNGGTLEPTGRKMPSKKYVDDAIDPYSPLLNITQASEFFPPDEYKDSGVEEAILDENKKILLSRKGVEWFFQKIRAGEISADQFAAEILSGNDILISGQSLLGIVPFLQASTFVDISEFSDSGYDSATFSENNRIIVGIKGTTIYFSKIVVGDAVIEGSDFTEVKGVTDALSPLPESVTFLSPDE
ncbi:TPA: hypothetical protein ACNBYW_003665, partial [Escherichia coli]